MNLDWLNNLDLIKRIKERAPAENSQFLRFLWIAQTFTCFFLIALVDPNVASVDFVGLKIPLLFIYFWTAVIGSYLSYHFRHETVKWLEYVGLITIAITCMWFIDVMRAQLIGYTGEIDLLLPTLHLFAGLYVSHSFELRSRFDFNFSQGVSLLIVCFAGALGKGGLFGVGLLLYLVLAAIMLLLDCESRTFGQVQARRIDGSGAYGAKSGARVSEKTANLIFPTSVLVLLSIGLFLVIPRAESFVDVITAQFYSLLKHDGMNMPNEKNMNMPKRTRSPFHVKKPGEAPKKHRDLTADQKKDDNTASGKDKNDKNDDAQTSNSGKGTGRGAGKAVKAGQGAPERGVNFSRTNEKKKQEKQRKRLEEINRFLDSNRSHNQDSQSGKGEEEQSSDASQSKSQSPDKTKTGKKIPKDKSLPDNNQKNKTGDEQGQGQSQPDLNQPASDQTNGEKGVSKNGSASGSAADKDKKGEGKTGESGDPKSGDPAESSRKGSKGKGGLESEKDASQKEASSDPSEKDASGEPTGKNGAGEPSGKNAKKSNAKKGKKQGRDPSRPPVFYMPDTMDSSMAADQDDIVLFRVSCNRTMFFRQGAFDHFDGLNWSISDEISKAKLQRSSSGTYYLNEVNPLSLSAEVPAIKVTQKFHMMKNMGSKLIFAGYPTVINYPCTGLTLDSCGNLRGSGNLIENLDYSVISDDPLFDIKKMIAEPVPSDEQEKNIRTNLSLFLQMPDNLSDEFFELSKSIAGLDDNWFLQAHRITNYVKTNYKYSTDPKYKTKSKNTVERFLFDTQSGDCKDFASAVVMLCRGSGIPARLVVGFTPGDFDSLTGTRQVKLKNAHAWAEVYCPGVGWVPFDATPVSEMPARAGEGERIFSSLTQQMTASTESAAVQGHEPNSVTIELPVPIGNTKTITLTWFDLIKLIPVLLFLIIIPGPLALMTKSFFSKKFDFLVTMHPASKVYCGLQRDLKKLGISQSESQTPGEFLQKLEDTVSAWDDQAKSQALVDAVEDFVVSYNETFFGGMGSAKDLQIKRQQIKNMLKKS